MLPLSIILSELYAQEMSLTAMAIYSHMSFISLIIRSSPFAMASFTPASDAHAGFIDRACSITADSLIVCSKQPLNSHLSPERPSSCELKWPISPAALRLPRSSIPSTIAALPTPAQPNLTYAIFAVLSPAQESRYCSPSNAALQSFSTIAGMSSALSSIPTPSMSAHCIWLDAAM